MALKDDFDAAVATFKAELDSMGFLDKGAKEAVDQELIDAIQADMDSLASSHDATFLTAWRGNEHEPTAEEVAHWLFDDRQPSEHRLSIIIAPTSSDEKLMLTFDVPRS